MKHLQQKHQAVFLSVGAWQSRKIELDGIDLQGVLWGLEFLRQVNLGKPALLFGSVVVIGGGNLAMDVAMSALGLGAESVQLVCLETREEMPAHAWECQNALDQGVQIRPGWGPKRILEKNGRVRAVELKRCTACFDDQGHFAPCYDESLTDILPADFVILAIGQILDASWLQGTGVQTGSDGTIRVDPQTLETDVAGIFSGGDAANQAGSVVDAVAAGRRGASSIDRFLGGDGNIDQNLVELDPASPRLGADLGFAGWSRPAPTCTEPAIRKTGFAPITQTLDREAAVFEAKRCLQCDLRLSIQPVSLPPETWQTLCEESLESVPQAEGVVLLLDQQKKIFAIRGVTNLQKALRQEIQNNPKACFFGFEQDKMYTQRETEYLQRYGLTAGGDDLDDLF